MSKIIKLATYKNLEAKVGARAVVSDEEVTAQIDAMMAQQTRLEAKKGPVENGDTTTIDFEGFKDGVAFEGGKAEGYQLEIGSHQFIPGFEEQMIGMKTGEEKDLDITFPEDYMAEDLKGQKVVFKVKVNEIKYSIIRT